MPENHFKLAICNELFEAWNTNNNFDFPRVFEYVKKSGYDGVEIAPFTIETNAYQIGSTRRTEIVHLAEQFDLKITGLHWLLAKTEGYYLTSPKPEVRQKTVDYFCELIQLCADLGGEVMVLGSPKQRNLLPGVTKDQAFGYAAEVLKILLPMLEKNGVRIALEPLAPSETDFLVNAEEGVRLIEMVKEPKLVSLHLDCKAMNAEEKPIPDVIRANKKYLTYFHLNDPNLRGPGFGKLEFKPILQTLLDIDYRGWLSVEVFDYTPGIEVLTEQSIQYIRQIM
ncbi:tagatose 3-epimerase [Planctomycetales bacterium]|nr:tagatose 3-epimerase [Planctomycetales bacterium]